MTASLFDECRMEITHLAWNPSKSLVTMGSFTITGMEPFTITGLSVWHRPDIYQSRMNSECSYETQMNRSVVNPNIIYQRGAYYGLNIMLVGDAILDKSKMIRDLAEVWTHMDENQIYALNALPEDTIKELHTLFFRRQALESQVENVHGMDFDKMATKDFIMELNNHYTLLFSIGTIFMEKEGVIWKKTMLLDPLYALIVSNGLDDKEKHLQFERHLEQVFLANVFGSEEAEEM